jgi:hypothetical protein
VIKEDFFCDLKPWLPAEISASSSFPKRGIPEISASLKAQNVLSE